MIPVLSETYAKPETLEALFGQFSTVPAGLFLTGPMDGADFGSLFTIETVLWWGLVIAFMNTLLVVRHTRQSEETGAMEMLLSTRASRFAPLAAVGSVAIVMNGIMAILIGGGMLALRSDWGDGSVWLYSASFAAFGIAWAAVAALCAQLFESARTTNAVLAIAIGVAFVLRGVGDFLSTRSADGVMYAAWPSWLSPFGWLQSTRSLTHPEWWPLILPIALAGVMFAAAFLLLAWRDEGAGIIPARRGRARASRFLRTPFGIAWYVQKNVFLGWLCGSLALVTIIGVLIPQMGNVIESSPDVSQLMQTMGGGTALIPSFLSAMLMIKALRVVAYGIHGISRIRSEESAGRFEVLFSTKLTRAGWLGLQGGIVLAGSALMLILSGLVLAVCVQTLSGIPSVDMVEYILAGLSYLPLVMLFMGVYGILFGVVPQVASTITWVCFGFVAFMSWLGPLLKIDDWIMNLSPLSHMASPPAESIILEPLAWIAGVAVVMGAVGLFAWRDRNLMSE
jgi:ABC-2 type transport system permease protein